MKKKITVAGLLCLFVWNVALSGIPSLLVCLHQDFLLHLESEVCSEHQCDEAGTHATTATICEADQDCTDVEISGTRLIPTRSNEVDPIQLPVVEFTTFIFGAAAPVVYREVSFRVPQGRAPPSVHWLTDLYLSKTVLRV